MLDVLVTGAAAGIIGCLSGQGVIALLAKNGNSSELSQRLDALEAKELVVKDDEFIGRAEIQEMMNGFALSTQKAINDQYTAMAQQISMMQDQNAKSSRVAEARQQVMQSPEPAMSSAQMQQMYAQVEQLTRQING